MLFELLAILVIDSVVLYPVEVESKGLGGFDTDTIDGDAKIPMDIGRAATGGHQPAIPSYRRLDYDCRLAIHRNFRRVNFQAGDHRGEFRVGFERVTNLVRESFRRGVRRQNEIDINGNRCRGGNDSRLRVGEGGLSGGCEDGPLDLREFLPAG